MHLTLIFADRYKIANHYTDLTAFYVENLAIKNLATRKGNAPDNFKFSLETAYLDYINESFLYLCYNTPVKLYLLDNLLIDGYIEKISIDSKGLVSFDCNAMSKYHQKQFFTPNVDILCQNDVYSQNCKLDSRVWKYEFTQCTLEGLSGKMTLSIDALAEEISLGGSTPVIADTEADGNLALVDGNLVLIDPTAKANNSIFLERKFWWNAYVVINDTYKTTVVNVTDEAIYLGLNFIDMDLIADKVIIYLKCDKTYGQCYSRFNNTKNFWGFANNGKKIQTYDIFSAASLTYCGEELADQDFEYCDTDFSIFGVGLHE